MDQDGRCTVVILDKRFHKIRVIHTAETSIVYDQIIPVSPILFLHDRYLVVRLFITLMYNRPLKLFAEPLVHSVDEKVFLCFVVMPATTGYVERFNRLWRTARARNSYN